jgi:hypothetical protein
MDYVLVLYGEQFQTIRSTPYFVIRILLRYILHARRIPDTDTDTDTYTYIYTYPYKYKHTQVRAHVRISRPNQALLSVFRTKHTVVLRTRTYEYASTSDSRDWM